MIELKATSRYAKRPRVNDLIPFFQKYGLFIFLFVLVIFSAIASPHFLSAENVEDLLNQTAPLGIVVIGQTFVILTGGLDLSVASLMATVAVITTSVGKANDAMVIPIFIISIVFAIAVGLGNGWLVTKRKVSPFLATLAMMIVLQGLRFAYTKGAPSGMLPPMFRLLGTGSWFGIPINLIALAVLTAGFALLLYKTSYGRMLYLTGGNRQAAFQSGIAVDRIVIAAYIICAVTAALGGLFLVGYTGSIDNWVGRGYELDSIAAVIMGGASFKGGQGGIFGALAGAVVLVIIFNLVLLLGLPVQAQMIVKGTVIILASAFYLSRNF